MNPETIFRVDALELVVDRFPGDEAHFPTAPADDDIASFFYTLAFDLVARTGGSLNSAGPNKMSTFIDSAKMFFSGTDANVRRRLKSFTEREPDLSIEENRVFLDMLREKYFLHIRGAKPECWECLLLDLEENSGREASPWRACDCDEEGGDIARRCRYYRAGWMKTSLAVTAGERNIASAGELVRRIYEICPALELLTDREHMEKHLFEEFFSSRSFEGNRSVRGVAVRLLTAFVERSLSELSLRLELPPERRFSLLS